MDKIAAFLIEKETITGKEFMKIFREVKRTAGAGERRKKAKVFRIQSIWKRQIEMRSAKTGAAEVTADVSEKTETDAAEAVSEEKQEQSGEDV